MTENTCELIPQDIICECDEANLHEKVEQAFSIGLASAIMAEFPVASILAIFKGNKGKKMVAEIDEITTRTGKSGGAKRVLAKIFSIYGFIGGIVSTAIYAFFAAYFSIYFTVLFMVAFSSLISNAL